MTLQEASFRGTFQTILVLVVVWWVLRMVLRAQAAKVKQGPAQPLRPKGDVRIERAPSRAATDERIIDADFEEIT